jgi:hypothetical protein
MVRGGPPHREFKRIATKGMVVKREDSPKLPYVIRMGHVRPHVPSGSKASAVLF